MARHNNYPGCIVKGVFAMLLVAASLPVTASAADLDYTYADAAFSKANSEIEDGFFPFAGGQGYLLDGSFGLNQHWFLEGSYQRHNFHERVGGFPTGFDFTATPKNLRLGGGFHTPVSDRVDFIAHLDYASAKTEMAPGLIPNVDDHGYVAGVGLRVQMTDALELDTGLDHDNVGFGEQIVSNRSCIGGCTVVELGQGGAENVLATALRYRFGMWGAGLEYRSSSYQGWREWVVSIRANF